MPRTGLSSEEIKGKAIEATLVKMREVGFEKVRLTDIAKELGVSHAMLYSDLLDAVSERWLLRLDEKLESICRQPKDPGEKIHDWALEIHRSKLEKVRHDPELYRAFDMATQQIKPFVKQHLENLREQLSGLVRELITERDLRNANADNMTEIVASAIIAFHHPRLVAQYIDVEREALLGQVIDSVLRGLDLRT
jgi:AcrR family transcriptional regulator